MKTIQDLLKSFIVKEEVEHRVISPRAMYLLHVFADYIQHRIGELLVELPATRGKHTTIVDPIPDSPAVRVAMITEDLRHLTGGRYYAYFMAIALVDLGYDVTIYTNREPVFKNEFSGYTQPKIQVVCAAPNDLENIDVDADMYLGSPRFGAVAAARLSKKYGRPGFAMVFDPVPMMDKFIGKHYAGWEHVTQEIQKTNINIITLCNETSKYINDWMSRRDDQVHEIYPCINSRERDKVKDIPRGDYAVFISRLVPHKNFDHALYAAREAGVRLKVIASVDSINAKALVEKMGMSKQVDFHMTISDREKFTIISGARAVIGCSSFEGFGMYVIEAIACGVPYVGYDYPTVREIEKVSGVMNMYLSPMENKRDLADKLTTCLAEEKFVPRSNVFDFDAMRERVSEVFKIEPKIGVVTIALNEEQFIGASLRAAAKHPNVAKIAVVEGAVGLFSHAAAKDGLSVDATRDEVFKVIEQDRNGDKIIYDRYGWAADKSELRNRALALLGRGITHVLVVDADEVWDQDELNKLVNEIREHPKTGAFMFKHHHFWKKKNLIAVGGQWDIRLFRCFRYFDKALRWDRHEMPVINRDGRMIHKIDGTILVDAYVHHYGYLKSEQRVLEKLEYYKKRDINLNVDASIYTDWKPGKETQPTHHGGTAIPFMGKHPEEVRGII